MPAEGNPVSLPDQPKGLPPVAPPSGKFIAQLFLVPLVIVSVGIGIIWLVRGLAVGFGTPDIRVYLDRLRDANPDIRWRAADDLAQFLHKDLRRDARFSADPALALDLAELLEEAARNQDPQEQSVRDALAKLAGSDADRERTRLLKKLETERSYLEYLTASVGNLLVPTGVPLLSDMALKQDGVNEEAILLRRRQAVWSLSNLGLNVERFATLPTERREEILLSLEQEAARSGKRGEWAKQALTCLASPRQNRSVCLGLDVTLAECAKAEQPELRKIVALAHMYWEGGPNENRLMEQTLQTLAHDDGFGAKEDQRVRSVEVRYHAALALARRGSEKVPFHLLQDMLSEEQLEKNLRCRQDGRDQPDRLAAQTTLGNVLKVIPALRERQPDRDLSALKPALEQLSRSSQAALRIEAERVLALVNQP